MRRAVVYQVVSGPALGRWRIRLEVVPETVGWVGGQVLWGHDQDTEEAAEAIAEGWVARGARPDYPWTERYADEC